MNSVLRGRPPFVAFDELKAVRIYQRNLPHWRQDGATYFVTFRLADSIPEGVRRQWEEEKARWLQARGICYDGERSRWRDAFEKLPPADQFRFHKHFNRQVQTCLDRGLGQCHLQNTEVIKIVREKLLHQDQSCCDLGDFVIMPNHVHLLVTPMPGQQPELILKSVKGASAVQCNRFLARSGTFWQADSYDHIVRSLKQLHDYRGYIADNPVEARVAVHASGCYRAPWMDEWFSP